jgi:hypothetical protein
VPTTIEPALGDDIQVVSEGEAFLDFALETGYVFPLEMVELTGAPRWRPKAYAPRDDEGSFNRKPEMREGNAAYFSLDLPLLYRGDAELVQP